jgi:hypothetical protein
VLGDPRGMVKLLDCLNPNLQKMQMSVRRKGARNQRRILRRHSFAARATWTCFRRTRCGARSVRGGQA